MDYLDRDFRYALVILREGFLVVAAIWTIAALVRARSQGVAAAASTSLAEATLAAGLVAIWALTVAPLRTYLPGFSAPPVPVTLVPVLPLFGGLLSPGERTWVAVTIAANLALYVPLGAGLAWRFGLRASRILVIALLVSTAVEAWQAVSGQGRSSDINDVLLNTIGALLGARLVSIAADMSRRVRRRRAAAPEVQVS
jgi:glycopeptide antibiotics resistance protein